MNFSQLSHSSQQQVIIGDLGSRPENIASTTWEVKGVGTEESILQYAHEQLKGVKILSESVEKMSDGKLRYSARIESSNGIPIPSRQR